MDARNLARLPSDNLGAKYLDNKQMESNFPDYHALLDRIEDRRKIASFFVGGTQEGNRNWYPQMYDNVFAILGGRGSGKSSVIQSLREILLNNSDSNIILPIIMPETISSPSSSILGWIMATAEQVIDSIEEEFQSLERRKGGRWICDRLPNDPMGFFKDCHLQRNNQLRERYESLQRDCNPDHVPFSSFSYDDMVGLRVQISQKQYALVRNLNEFWNQVTAYWKRIKTLQAEENNKNNRREESLQPLIILMFDDVDLVPERSLELLNSTFQYFTNPNIVLILTAAEKVLEQVIWTKMLERMVGSNYQSLCTDFYPKDNYQENRKNNLSLESIDKMAREYYDKVIPPANRYHLRRYSTISERKRYRYASMCQSFCFPQEDVSIELDSFLIKQIKILEDESSGSSFICNSEGQLREGYLLMFGDKSRNISNGCLAILNCVTRLKRYALCANENTTIQQRWGEIHDALRQLLSILISSNRLVKEFKNDALRLIYQTGTTGEVRVNHDGLWSLYAKQLKGLNDNQLKLYEQIPQWVLEEDAVLKESFQMKQQEQLGNLQKQVTILLVMLTFVDKLRMLACKGFPGVVISEASNQMGDQGLSAMLNADAFTFLSKQQELAQSWSWLVLFPHSLTTDGFLTRSPHVLEHVDHYVTFDPFDPLKVQEYLMDTFYCSVINNTSANEDIDGENIEKQIQLGRCSPESLLTMALPTDQTWVESVLAMLFLRYSGITAAEPSILHFSQDSRETLEYFQFGGYLNSRIKKTLATFLKGDLSRQTLQGKLYNYISRIRKNSKSDSKNKTIINSFFQHQEEPIGRVFNWYLETYSEERRKSVAEWYAAKRMPITIRSDKDFAQWVIQEVGNAIKDVSVCLGEESIMLLTSDACADLLEAIDDVPIGTKNLREMKNACKQELEIAKRKLSEESSPTLKGGDSPKTVAFSLTTLIEYIRLLDSEIAHIRTSQDQDSINNFWAAQIIQSHFKLSSILNPSIARDKAPVKIPNSNNGNQKLPFLTIPRNGWVVLMISMIEHLMPAYFTAKFLLQDTRQEEFSRSMSSGQYIQEEKVNQQLENMYRALIEKKERGRLGRMMAEVRDRVVKIYIEWLRNMENG